MNISLLNQIRITKNPLAFINNLKLPFIKRLNKKKDLLFNKSLTGVI